MRVLVITSCTGEKYARHPKALTLSDFRQGPEYVRLREKELESAMMAAEDLYAGRQHELLMRGVRAFRRTQPSDAVSDQLDLWILSAGYGMVPNDRRLAPYEATFVGMSRAEVHQWAEQLGIPGAFRQAVSQPYDLGLILLGDDYLEACELDETVHLGGHTILFSGSKPISRLPNLENLSAVPLSNPDAKEFGCGIVSLKGDLAARLLFGLARDRALADRLIGADSQGVLQLCRELVTAADPEVDEVIEVPESWRSDLNRQKLMYFIPDWDDLVDHEYQFRDERGGIGGWECNKFAHQLYPSPNYDGILVSKFVIEDSKRREERVNQLGIHRYLRVPGNFPVMGDCGAFGYINDEVPPYTTGEILDYYERLGFDYGVSIDHLIFPSASEAERQRRYKLTVDNAMEFLEGHRSRGYAWTPVGAVQGWDADSYAEAARKYVEKGYKYLGLGGLVRSQTADILDTVREVRRVVPPDIRIHVFGLARFAAIRELVKLNVSSVDSASLLRKAWLGKWNHYLTPDGWYSALRIPQTHASFRGKQAATRDASMGSQALEIREQSLLQRVREYDASGRLNPPDELVNDLADYELVAHPVKPETEEKELADAKMRIRRTLTDRPWTRCDCAICRAVGMDVAIFRGNNRNRRRGFHNTYVFYQTMKRALRGESVPWLETQERVVRSTAGTSRGLPGRQMQMSLPSVASCEGLGALEAAATNLEDHEDLD